MTDLILDINDYKTHSDVKYGRVDHLMEHLGVSYKQYIAHPYASALIFEDCDNIPKELPYYLTIQGDAKVVTEES